MLQVLSQDVRQGLRARARKKGAVKLDVAGGARSSSGRRLGEITS